MSLFHWKTYFSKTKNSSILKSEPQFNRTSNVFNTSKKIFIHRLYSEIKLFFWLFSQKILVKNPLRYKAIFSFFSFFLFLFGHSPFKFNFD